MATISRINTEVGSRGGVAFYAFFESLRLRRAPVNQAQYYIAGGSCPGPLTTDRLSRVLRGHRGTPRAALPGIATRLLLSTWTSHFQAASVGAIHLAEGPYLRDFEKFVVVWHQELEHLKAHRANRSGGRSR